LDIGQDGACIRFGSPAGAFHAVSTLIQLIAQYGRRIPCMEIRDAPDFPARGIMLDISRDKIPTMDTLRRLVDFMAGFKMNQLQLYVEGFSFAYPSFPQVWQGGTPMTGEEVLEFDRYCAQRFIELVPNQNCFGHMGAWLGRREFARLAECPAGYDAPWAPGKVQRPETLDPSDPGSIKLIEAMAADLLPYFSSDLFNVGCDETVELGQGKSRAICEERGTGRVYLEFLQKVSGVAKSRGKRMMFWCDIIMEHPELIGELPGDAVAMEWGYEAGHPFREDGKRLRDAGIPFYVCPGTSTWNSLTGRTRNMQANLLNAAVHGRENGAIGYLLTDWGDNGHWQYLPFSYPGFAYGAALSWGAERNRWIDVAAALDRFVFQDESRRMGGMIMALGNYYLNERVRGRNATAVAKALYSEFDGAEAWARQAVAQQAGADAETAAGAADVAGPADGAGAQAKEPDAQAEAEASATVDDFTVIREHAGILEHRLCETRLSCDDAALIDGEFRNAARFVRHGCDVGTLRLLMERRAGGASDAGSGGDSSSGSSGAGDGDASCDSGNANGNASRAEDSGGIGDSSGGGAGDRGGDAILPLLERMDGEMDVLLQQHEALWLARNRAGGLDDSLKKLKGLKAQYGKLLGGAREFS
ncbi:MAG: family 20 glycosylhydrolase, partial [Clostridiales bacterium]|nr:family 20 glycosylhydrolase [Clostridiales bacterium]